MRILIVLLLLLSAPGVFADDPVHVASGEADGNRFTFSLSKAEIEAVPKWGADSERHALSPRYAIDVARNQLKTFVADGDNWRLGDICLFDLGADRWIYVV
ncbi:MAG: hypothetical protein H0W20_10780 [Chthoniobacterales bacterium]|nr:hypothetical protein [Chthoniobacterales bacterium]